MVDLTSSRVALKVICTNESEIKEVDQSNARCSECSHLPSDSVKIYISGVNLIWGFGWVGLALVWSANISVSWRLRAGAAGRRRRVRERRGVSAVCTWGPAGYNTPVELWDHLTVSHRSITANQTHVEADGYSALPTTLLASDVHEKQFCGFWHSQVSHTDHVTCLFDCSERFTTVTAPRNKSFLNSHTSCQNDGFKNLFCSWTALLAVGNNRGEILKSKKICLHLFYKIWSPILYLFIHELNKMTVLPS